MVTEEERLPAEIPHGRFIRERHPELWDGSTPAGRRILVQKNVPLVSGIGAIAERIPVLREVAGSCVIFARKPV
jgi:hypothetical protein